MQKQFNSKIVTFTIIGFLVVAVLLIVFRLGMLIGEKRADFTFRWAENYHRNFSGPKEGFFGNLAMPDFTSSHSVFGAILDINNETLMVKDRDGIEKSVIVSSGTVIEEYTAQKKLTDLKEGMVIAVVGSANANGQIEAKLIRIFPKK